MQLVRFETGIGMAVEKLLSKNSVPLFGTIINSSEQLHGNYMGKLTSGY